MSIRDIPLLDRFFGRDTNNRLDGEWQGDNLSDDKDNRHLRVMFHNINGLSTRNGTDNIAMFAHDQKSLQIDIQGFSEHCLDTTKFQVMNDLQNGVRATMDTQVCLHMTSSTEAALHRYKPGGTGLLLLGGIVGRQEPQGRGGDRLGRWSYIHFRRKHKKPLTIIAAYQVCPRPTNLLGNTAYHQQMRELNVTGRTGLHPRQAFIQDLGNFIAELRSKEHDIILGGDFNESLEDKHSGILNLINRHNLIDPFLSRFPQHSQFGTHYAGKKRIDYTFITPSLYPNLLRVGYAPFDYSTSSDHRAMVLEFDKTTLFGYRDSPIVHPTCRALKSKDRKSVRAFISKWYTEISARNGFSLLAQLEDDTATPNVAETVDEIIGISGDLAEQVCKKRRPEFYSRQIVQQRLNVSILRRHLNSLKAGCDRTTQLTARMQRAGLDFHLPHTEKYASEALHQARQALRQTCTQNSEIRQAELAAKINEAHLRGNKPKAKILKAIKRVEDHQRTFQILKQMKQSSSHMIGIDRLEIPSSWPAPDVAIESTHHLEDPKKCTNWKWVTAPEEVEHYLMLRNRLHFGQAEGTPFTCPPLRDDVDWAASTETATQILQGSYQYASEVPNCDDLIMHCKATSQQDAVPAELSLSEFRGKILKWRETTTTSPSGRHLGRYKSLFTQGEQDSCETSNEGPGEGPSLSTMQERITALILALINYCIRHTYALERWKTIINVMIFKEPGNFQIHKLRIIHIYEADFNLLLAVKWRNLLRHAVDENILHEGQYGGRPGCEAQSLTLLLEELKYDISYLTRRTLFNFDNDATSCYDRIVVPLASLINRKYGLHNKVVAVHASTLQQAKFFLKTATGISANFYSPSKQFPIHGTGQGSGNSPSIWLFISSTLFDIHTAKSQGARFVSPDGKHSVKISMVGFVDDSTGTCNDFQPNSEKSIDELLQIMTADAQLWSNLLYCTGGKLELLKCSFHVLQFEFRPDGRPIPKVDKYDNRIQLRDMETKENVPITSKRAFDPHLTLGHYKSPTTQGKRAMQNLQLKAARTSLLICTSPITRQGAYLAYHTVYLPTVRYTLPQSYFSRQALDTAQCPSIHKLIAKCGYNRNTTRALIYAPISYAGGGFIPWYLLQGEGQIQHLLKHWRTDTLVSRTLRIAISWLQWQSGWSQSVFYDTTSSIPYLESRWLTSLRCFLQQVRGRIMLDQSFIQKCERQHDIYIMDYASECGMFTSQELKIINYCRLYLHVTTVSELFDATGTIIMPAMFSCQREEWFDPGIYVTLQKRPSEYQIKQKWQKLCRHWSLASGRRVPSMDLGEWTVSGNELRRRRRSYLVESPSCRLYHWQGDCYWECLPVDSDASKFRLSHATAWVPITTCTPVEIKTTGVGHLALTAPVPIARADPRSPVIPLTFQQYVTNLSPWEQRLLSNIVLHLDPDGIVQHLESTFDDNNGLMLVSDGSVRGPLMTYGWVCGTAEKVIFAEHSGAGAGTPTSHRAEAWGMLSGTLFVSHLIKFVSTRRQAKFPAQQIKVYCDNKGLVTRVQQRSQYDRSYPNATLAPDWDVVEQIHETLSSIPLTEVEVEWVKGHQEAGTTPLPPEAEFNVQADSLAGEFQPDPSDDFWTRNLLPAEKCRLLLDDVIIQSHYCSAIRNAYLLPPFFTYLQEKHGWTQETRRTIDWTTFTSAVSLMDCTPVQLLKLVHNKLPTNVELAKSNIHQSRRCTYCECDETFYHLVTCTNEKSQQHRDLIIHTISDFLQQKQVTTEFQNGVLYCLARCLRIPSDITSDGLTSRAAQCVDLQLSLGHHFFLRGFLVQTWQSLLHSDTSVTLTDTLIPRMIVLLWERQLAFWEDHLQTLHQTHKSSVRTEDRLLSLKTQIRYLHSQRNQVLAAHRDQYFYDDVETFLDSATKQQMLQYVHHYESAITASISLAASQPSRTLLSFSGFQRISTAVARVPLFRQISHHVPRPDRPRTTHRQQGDQLLRKHTRWKPSSAPLQSLRNYFKSSYHLGA